MPSTYSRPVMNELGPTIGSGAGGHCIRQLSSYLPTRTPLVTHAPGRVGSHAVPPTYGGSGVDGGMPARPHWKSNEQVVWLWWRRPGRLRVMPTRWSGVWAVSTAVSAGIANANREGDFMARAPDGPRVTSALLRTISPRAHALFPDRARRPVRGRRRAPRRA